MYLDIPDNANTTEATMATFKETGPGRTIRAIRLHLDDGVHWCAITGWDESGPVAARFTPIEESGDGPARLASGGDWGLRLARISAPGQPVVWDLADAAQWGEPLLICTPETEVVEG